MAKHGPLKKPSMAQMPTLVWMLDHPNHLLVSASVLSHASYSWKEPDGTRVEEGPEVPRSLAVHRLLQSGWLRQTKKDGEKWSWYEHPYAITKDGMEMAAKHRAKWEEHAAKKAAKEKEAERYIVISNTSRWAHDKRQYAALCKVVKETDKRLYIERVDVDGEKENGKTRIQFESRYIASIQGRTGHEYVEKDVVSADGVTVEEYLAMREVETSKIAWMTDLKAREDAELNEIRERYRQRREQNEYAYEDELREALGKVKRNVA